VTDEQAMTDTQAMTKKASVGSQPLKKAFGSP
jgi:hypothetical protein